MTAVLSLSSGVTNILSSQIKGLGGNIAVIQSSLPTPNTSNILDATFQQHYITSSITEQDLTSLSALPSIDKVAPMMLLNGAAKSTHTTVMNDTIVATSPDLASIANLSLGSGQFIDDSTDRDTSVIGDQLSIDLFGTDQSIGQTFTIHGQTFRVIGVLKPVNNPINFNSVDFDHTAIIKLDTGKSFNQGVAQIQQIDIRAKDAHHLPGAIKDASTALRSNHMGEQNFTILSGNAIAKPTNQYFTIIGIVMTTIAAISLIVGGIGIMNIMLVGVAERTREIGLRKSVGASNANIVWQFLVESLIISFIGGLIGYLLGYGSAFIVSTILLTFSPAVTWQIALAALGISLFVGVLFGIYPALRAARKDPIEALRQYH